ncbi:MAG: 1-deoxy-D-xylulose-5-phosphate synthase [Oscillospiraceae bacterium]|nr:1-deoxy-D-xylulose-5-phosphate synthase [Oscillospiraceae bacterium]
MGKLLKNINSPKDVKKLGFKKLKTLCTELRYEIINLVAKNGGHLSSNLGVVELTVALHYVFNSPIDKIIFDVGHQSYAHKMLTGRFKKMVSIRKSGGISGFPNPDESKHDAFITGHSSTSISIAVGISRANDILQKHGYVIALIGDGSLSGGLAYEALNNAGLIPKNFIVILNDNKMSICKNVGSMAKYLSKLRANPVYVKAKSTIKQAFDHIPVAGGKIKNLTYKTKTILRKFINKSNFFEDMGFSYYGPIDGHNINNLIDVFNAVKSVNRPVLVHVDTKKGKGYCFAEKNPEIFHGAPKFDIKTGCEIKSENTNFSNLFGRCLCNFANKDKRICAITASMKTGTGLLNFEKKFPERFFDVGIAESHAVTFAAGLASCGALPVFAVYSSFLQRSYDQIIHDAAIGNYKIVLAVDRAGVIGEDGKTHQGLFDVSFLNAIPNVTIFTPGFFDEIENMMEKCLYKTSGVAVIRYPRGQEGFKPKDFISNKGETTFCCFGDKSSKIAVVTYGRIFSEVCLAHKKLKKSAINIFCIKINQIKPIDKKLVELLKGFDNIFFIEEGMLRGSVAEHLNYLLTLKNCRAKILIKAVNEKFVEQGSVNENLKLLGFNADSISKFIKERIL